MARLCIGVFWFTVRASCLCCERIQVLSYSGQLWELFSSYSEEFFSYFTQLWAIQRAMRMSARPVLSL